MTKQFQYKNVVISSLPGSGRSTLAKLLHGKLQGWEFFSGGGFMRQYAIDKGFFKDNTLLHHFATVYTDDFDRQVDLRMRRWLQKKGKMIIESWLCGFLAQGIPGTLKILLVCKKALRIDRMANRDEVKVSVAKENLEKREESNCIKWNKIYAKEWQNWIVKKKIIGENEPINYWNEKLYDLVIDTYNHSKEETFKVAYNALMNGVQEKYQVSEEWIKENLEKK